MYAQMTRIRVPAARMKDLRSIIENEYLPIVSRRPGFVAAYLMEQVDDENSAQMLQLWDSHAAAEAFTRTGSFAASLQALAVHLPGIRIERDGFIVRVSRVAAETPAFARV
ncbi:MAG: antibiotic biosynthesis monooxygenase [Chloroflexota bacterium]